MDGELAPVAQFHAKDPGIPSIGKTEDLNAPVAVSIEDAGKQIRKGFFHVNLSRNSNSWREGSREWTVTV